MQPFSRFLAACCVLATPALAAHETAAREARPERVAHGPQGYWDFRFGFGFEPPLTDAEYDAPGQPTYSQDWEGNGGSFEFNVSHRFDSHGASSGFITFGPFVRGFGGEDDSYGAGYVNLGAFGLQLGGGYCLRRGVYSLEIGPRIGLGAASASEEFFGDEIESDTGSYLRWDFGITNALTFRAFQFGATLGLAGWDAEVHYPFQLLYAPGGPYEIDPFDATYSGAGGYVLFFLGFR